ncbi:tripartite motif-containing protein 45 [Sabethes cyaneus]|uniref:tripartite motif-containing protein 45 n=1 Tax=Sabethes cyaneus TaxID=53552 RepID=UPI00237E7B98|nr:tripartite motif-containing protein 45 [Sabethes cyaneus]
MDERTCAIGKGGTPAKADPISNVAGSASSARQKVKTTPGVPRQSDSEDSDLENPAKSREVDRYIRLREEHVEAVVILKKESVQDSFDKPDNEESLVKNNGKLTFNLTPEQLGNVTGCGAVSDVKKINPPGSAFSEDKSITRKSSLRRNSLHCNQIELEKLYTMEPPKPIPQIAGLFDVPKKILMPLSSGEQNSVDVSSIQDKKLSLKFDEILTVYDEFPTDFLPAKYLCGICRKLCNEPRVLDCLHSFCKRCLIELEASTHNGSNLFWRRMNESCNFELDSEATGCSCMASSDEKGQHEKLPSKSATKVQEPPPCPANSVTNFETFNAESRFDQIRASFQSFKEKNCLKSPSKEKIDLCFNHDLITFRLFIQTVVNMHFQIRAKATKVLYSNQEKHIQCPTCGLATEIPLGGVHRLPPHFVMARKIEDMVSACGNPPPNILCELCSSEVSATSSCTTCSLKLCSFCREAHERQRNTSAHIVRSVGELLKKSRRPDPETRSIKCPMHPEHQLKLFCTTCHQVICNECTVHVHWDHKHTSASKACKIYSRFVRNAIEQTKPLEDYAMQAIGRLNDLSVRISGRCEAVQRDVEAFVDEYIEALEEHRKTLLKQIDDVREAKMEMIIAQQSDLEQRSRNARAAVEFAEEIISEGNEIENLVFVSILLNRLEYCLKSNRALDFKVTDTLEFLPDELAPCFKLQSPIVLYGVVTTQKADPRKCTLENCAELACLKVHKKVELSLVTKDYEGKTMNHGGLMIQTDLRYRDEETRVVSLHVVDNRNGTYRLSFLPERAGVMNLMISVDGKVIGDCPYVLRIHNLRPHSGVYHCCSFCSSNGSKVSTCACGSIMPGGYRGCGHGHEGHPGQRHWSCCANLTEYSDCVSPGKNWR